MKPAIVFSLTTFAIVCFLPQGRADARPNIVWIFVEDMNDWMGCYGDDTVPTPNIDRIAAEGVRFDRAYMPAGVCSATRSAIALGAMQTSLGVHNHRSSRQRVPEEVIRLPPGVKTVYQLLREAGYFVYSSPVKDDFNFVFDRGSLYDYVVPTFPPKKGFGLAGPEWRRRAEDQPFFAQIQLRGGKYADVFRGKADDRTSPVDPASVRVPPYYPDIPAIRKELALHYDCIRQTDEEVGEVLTALAADGLLENTVVFFWTDHGMRLYRHKQWLYEGGIRVPLVVMGPGTPQGTVRDDLVSGIDITTTTLALAGVEPQPWMEGQDLFAADFTPREFVVGARDRCDYTIERVRSVTTERYKYLRNFLTDRPFMQPQYRDGHDYIEAPRALHKQGKLTPVQEFWWSEDRVPEELYDLQNDPDEIHNLAGDPAHAETLNRRRKILADWIAATGDQGQHPESIDSLRGVLKEWGAEAVNPEFDAAR
jgi:arylsulfatase A-like enzyme